MYHFISSKLKFGCLFLLFVFSGFRSIAQSSFIAFQIHEQKINDTLSVSPFKQFKAIDPSSVQFNKFNTYWLSFKIDNPNNFDQEYILTTNTKWGNAQLYLIHQQDTLKNISGCLLPFIKRSNPSSSTSFKFRLKPKTAYQGFLALTSQLSVYVPSSPIKLTLSTLGDHQQQNFNRLWLQGIFIGIVLVMALYNMLIYLAVRDISYLYYVFSLIGVGFYFLYYYGFGIEIFWKNSPVFDSYSYAFIIPITNLARIYFTKSYLHLPQVHPKLNKQLDMLVYLCLVIFFITGLSYFMQIDLLNLIIDLIGLLGILVLSEMLLCGVMAYRNGYKPARYFIWANAFFVLGGILFIFMELGWLPDNLLTRYSVQYGLLTQVVIFSLGLSSRLNQANLQVANLELEKERERKEFLETQSKILQQKVAEQTANLTELNAVKDKLLSIISHDLRNPLVSLDSFLSLLINHKEKLSEDEQVTLAQKARQSLGNLNQLLTNLLLWTRSQMSLVKYEPQWIELAPKIEANLKLYAIDIELKQLQIETFFDTQKPIYADKEMVDFTIRNLLGNAIKFSKASKKIDILLSELNNSIVLEIKDEGIGMSEKQLLEFGDKRMMTSKRGTAKEKGTGLGLFICKEFVEKMGGKLEIESTLGSGTSVKVTWINFKSF